MKRISCPITTNVDDYALLAEINKLPVVTAQVDMTPRGVIVMAEDTNADAVVKGLGRLLGGKPEITDTLGKNSSRTRKVNNG